MNSQYVCVQIVGADIPGTISWLSNNGIILRNIRFKGALTVSLDVHHLQYKQLAELAKKRDHKVRIDRVSGFFRSVKNVFHRPLLVASLSVLLVLSLWLPGRVLFVRVEGNQTVATTKILQQAEACGIYFGARRSAVRSEIVKNHLLEAVPELRWVGVNTKGCTAVIHVKEEAGTETEGTSAAYSSIVADRDGIVTSCTVTSGTPVCAVGDAVKAGQVLVSGYQDLGLLVKLTRSQGEVFAQTDRLLELITPIIYTQKQEPVDQTTKYSLIIGKKRINLSKGSGISYTGCDKICTEYYVTLPGGFVLPAVLAVETMVAYEEASVSVDPKTTEIFMEAQADSYLLEQAVSVTVLDKSLFINTTEEASRMALHYICEEMIGRERPEEMDIHYGKND